MTEEVKHYRVENAESGYIAGYFAATSEAAAIGSMACEAGYRSLADMIHQELDLLPYRDSEDERQAEVTRATDAWQAEEAHTQWRDADNVVLLFPCYAWTSAHVVGAGKVYFKQGRDGWTFVVLNTSLVEVENGWIDDQADTSCNGLWNAVLLERTPR